MAKSKADRIITVEMNHKCARCGKVGALESGICLTCAADDIRKLGRHTGGAPQFNENNFAIAKLAIEDADAYSVTGILVAEDRTCVTDGRIVLEISTPTRVDGEQLSLFGPTFEAVEKFEPFILPRKEALEIAKAIALKHDKEEVKRARIGHGDDAVAVINVSDSKCDRTFVTQKLNQKFPDYRSMMANFPPAKISVTVNCDYLIALLQMIAKVTGCGIGSPVTITVRDPDQALSFAWTNEMTGQKVRAALMPMQL